MFRGEIFAYPLYLQSTLSRQNVTFFCSDVACKYWPYLKKVVVECPELRPLLNMRPLLSVMHAKPHDWTCELQWSGRNQEGAGLTIGEEVEQVNSFLSRAAICTKYMSKAARTDMLTVLAVAWNKRKSENMAKYLTQRYIKTAKRIKEESESLAHIQAELHAQDSDVQQWVSEVQQLASATSTEDNTGLQSKIVGLYLSIKHRKHHLYRQTESNKRRHKIRRRICGEKAALEAAIEAFNLESTYHLPSTDELLMVDNYRWPWECPDTSFSTKKVVFDGIMMLSRLREEEQILVREIKQHWESLREAAGALNDLSKRIKNESSDLDLSEESCGGLLCVLKAKCHNVLLQQKHARTVYQQGVLGQGTDTIVLDDTSDEDDEGRHDSSDDEADTQ